MYGDNDIRTVEGLQSFIDDAHTAWLHLARRAYNWRDS